MSAERRNSSPSQASLTSQTREARETSQASLARRPGFLRPQKHWESLHFYQKTDVLYQMTFAFTQRFLKKGDRTIDQMVQAARSGKQNIVEGAADGVTSSEMEIRLMNVARASIKELKEDYADYLATRGLEKWSTDHPRYDAMLAFCREHNIPEDYLPFFEKWTDEEMCNIGLTLCHMVDKMMTTFITQLEGQFVTQGGIKERMTAARLGYRTDQREQLRQLEAENARHKTRIHELEVQLSAGSAGWL